MLRRINTYFFNLCDNLSGQRVRCDNSLDLVAEKLDADQVALIRRKDFEDIAAEAEGSAVKLEFVAHIMNIDELSRKCLKRGPFTDLGLNHQESIILGIPEAVNTAHRRDNQCVRAVHEVRRCAEAQAVDVFVDIGVLFYICVRFRQICFRLVIIIIADEIFDGVRREKLRKFTKELCGKGFVVRNN